MATFDATTYDLDGNWTINMNRKHGRIWLDFAFDGFFVDMPVPEFVAWCQSNGTKLMTYMPGWVYHPEFRDDEAGELFRATWMIEANLIPNALARRPPSRTMEPA